MPVAERLDAKVDEVEAADDLEHRECSGRCGNHRSDAHRNEHRVDDLAAGIADDREERLTSSVLERPAHDEQHARAGNDDDNERERAKGEQRLPRDHAVTERVAPQAVAAGRSPALTRNWAAASADVRLPWGRGPNGWCPPPYP